MAGFSGLKRGTDYKSAAEGGMDYKSAPAKG